VDHHFDITVEHKKKLLNMHVNIMRKIEHLLGKEKNIKSGFDFASLDHIQVHVQSHQ